jgi:hypothetical protein
MFDDLFSEKPHTETHRFLLTKLKNGKVKAETIESANDPRLSSTMPFALIALDRFVVTEEELYFDRSDTDLMKVAECIDGDVVDGVGVATIMRPRVAKNLGGIDAFFLALTGITKDVVLTPAFEEEADGEGYWSWVTEEECCEV